MINVWTKEDYHEYERQCKRINDAYAGAIPQEVVERYAAQIVNHQKELVV